MSDAELFQLFICLLGVALGQILLFFIKDIENIDDADIFTDLALFAGGIIAGLFAIASMKNMLEAWKPSMNAVIGLFLIFVISGILSWAWGMAKITLNIGLSYFTPSVYVLCAAGNIYIFQMFN